MAKAEQLLAEQRENMGQSIAKGIGHHLGFHPKAREVPARERGVSRSTSSFEIEIDQIVADPDQPRREIDPEGIERMAGSMLTRGQITPISVRWVADLGKWVIVAGERRWRGARMAGLKTMMAVERKGPDDRGSILADQLIENIQREDLSAIDKAHSFRHLMDLKGWSGNRLATELRICQSSVVESLALLKIPEALRDQVRLETVPASTAYELSRIDDPAVQADVARQVVAEGLTRKETKERVRQAVRNKSKGKPKSTARFLRNRPGMKLRIEYRKGIDRAALREFLLEIAAEFADVESHAA